VAGFADGAASVHGTGDAYAVAVSRRTATLVVSGLLLAGLVAVAALLPVPYVVFRPGPLTDVLAEGEDGSIIVVDGAPSYDTTGALTLTTVGVTPAGARMDLLTAMRAWIDPDRAVVPRDIVYPGDPTTEEARERNAAVFSSSQELATVAALRYLDFDVPVEADQVIVREVLEGGAADGTLEPGDQILAVNGEPVRTPTDVVASVTTVEPGETLRMDVVRDGTTTTIEVPTAESEVNEGQAAIGVIVGQAWDLPVDVEIDVPGDIGGSSAGLVFALGVIDTMTEESLLDDLAVAGTGEISPDGNVGAISGVQQKIAGAREEGSQLFLAPSANCGAAIGADAGDMLVVPVDTLDEAVDVLEDVRAGDVEGLPSCADDAG
jgi:PDZ domain-containing protein